VSPTSTDALTSAHPYCSWSAREAPIPVELLGWELLEKPLLLTHRQSEEQPSTEARQRQGVFRSKLPKPAD